MNLDKLQEFLYAAQIPEFKQKPKTFLEIANQPHYENVISNIYAFFFDTEEEHMLGDLFINSLVNCMKGKFNNEWSADFNDFDVLTEYTTKEGRIDILLINDDSAIIIENKIYHHLNNDLAEYSEYIKDQVSNDCVYGIVLSLKEIKSKQDNFISLTHKELLNEVLQNIGEYLINASEKYIGFLKDFYLNIINLSEKNMKNNELEFYLTHQKKITDLVKLENHYKDHIKSEIKSVCNMLDDVNLVKLRKGERESRLRYIESSKIKDLLFTIEFTNLLNSKLSFYLIIELRFNTLKHFQLNFSKLNEYDLSSEVKINQGIKNTNSSWYHLTSTEVSLTKDDVSNLSDVIYKKLFDLKFIDTFKKIEKLLLNN